MCVEDPNKPDSDLGKNSFNIRNVQRALEHAFFMLAVRDNNAGLGDTMLGSILKWDQRWDRCVCARVRLLARVRAHVCVCVLSFESAQKVPVPCRV